jgi:hypothetical protein
MGIAVRGGRVISVGGLVASRCECCSSSQCCYEDLRGVRPDGRGAYRCRLQYRSFDVDNVGLSGAVRAFGRLSGCDGRFPDFTQVQVFATCCGDPDLFSLSNSPWRDSYCGTNPAAGPLKSFLFVLVNSNDDAPCRMIYFYPIDCAAQLGATVVYSSPAGTYSDFSGCRSIAPVSCFPYVIPSSAPPVLTVSPNPLP